MSLVSFWRSTRKTRGNLNVCMCVSGSPSVLGASASMYIPVTRTRAGAIVETVLVQNDSRSSLTSKSFTRLRCMSDICTGDAYRVVSYASTLIARAAPEETRKGCRLWLRDTEVRRLGGVQRAFREDLGNSIGIRRWPATTRKLQRQELAGAPPAWWALFRTKR